MSLTLVEARARAAVVGDVAYDVHLDLTGPDTGTFGSTVAVTFDCTAERTFLELTAATDLVVRLDGEPIDPAYDGRRIQLGGLGGRHRVEVGCRLPYTTDGDGMHHFVDPADGETYVAAYLGMDIAQKIFACFDQNDLKAPIGLTVSADPRWTVLANGLTEERDGGQWRFATTLPIPPALFVVGAGPWTSRRWEHAGLEFGWHARASVDADLERDLDELRATTEACFDWYARTFTEPYPFDSYDQLFAPGLNWGAQEMPGCVTYRDELLPRGRTSEQERLQRAATIAHEMAHMWFGDLVTMTWWEDTWLQESFADYFGYRVCDEALDRPEAQALFECARKVTGYDADRRRSTHPVAPMAEDVPDVDAAAGNFDMISYAKGNACLKQLVTWLGDDAFLAGLDTYLSRHRFGNATLADFVAALDEASERDVRGWVEVWLRRSGFDTLRMTRDGADDVPVLTREGVRPHTVGVTAYDDTWEVVGRERVDVGAEPVRLERWAGRVVVPNSGGETFARLLLDDRSWEAVSTGLSRIDDATTRAVLWTAAADLVVARDLPASAYVDLVARELPGERCVPVVGSVFVRVIGTVVPTRVAPDDVAAAYDVLASAFGTGTLHSADPELAAAFAAGLVVTTRDVDTMLGWLDTDALGELPLPPSLRWSVVRRLASVGAADAAFVEAERRRDGGQGGGIGAELGAARALAARPTREAKEAAWAAASEPEVSNRRFSAVMSGLWHAEQAALLEPYVDRYLAEAPRWALRGQAFAQEVGRAFPHCPLTSSQVDAFEAALATDLPPVLARQWADRVDDLR